MATFLALIATTMGIGALYYGLPQARYRKKLLDDIEEAFRSQSYRDDLPARIDAKLKNKTIAEAYHYLAMWWSELPGSTRTNMKGTVGDIFDGVSQSESLPFFYEWFRFNVDKYACLLAAVLIPLIGLWVLHYSPSTVSKYQPYCELWLAFAQLLVIAHMIYGATKVNAEAITIRRKLSTLVTKVESDI